MLYVHGHKKERYGADLMRGRIARGVLHLTRLVQAHRRKPGPNIKPQASSLASANASLSRAFQYSCRTSGTKGDVKISISA